MSALLPKDRVGRVGGEAGFTLVELMVTVAIAGIAISAALAVGFTMNNQYREHRETVDTERAARVALDLIADAVRGASPGARGGNIVDGHACSTNGDGNPLTGISVRNNAGAESFDSTTWGALDVSPGTDVLELIHASGGVFTTVTSDFTVGTTAIEVTNGALLTTDDMVVVTNLDSGVLLRVTGPGQADEIPVATGCLGTPPTFAAGALVIRARLSRFFVTTLPGDPWPSLMVDIDGDGTTFEPEPIAPGIEDLQIALGIDDGGDADGLEEDGLLAPEGTPSTTDEWYFNVTGDTTPPSIQSAFATSLRAARVNLVARALDPAVQQSVFSRPALEDHAAGAADEFRRRVLSTIVEFRNLQGAM